MNSSHASTILIVLRGKHWLPKIISCWLVLPGTGKTSRALRLMVERFRENPEVHILLMAYINRAVDEIWATISTIAPAVDFIRVGSELSCDAAYRNHLMENELALCTRSDRK